MQVHKETLSDERFECVAAFNSNIQHIDHLRTHQQESTLKCMYCSETYSSPDTRKLHENIHTREIISFVKFALRNLRPKGYYNDIYCCMGLKSLSILECG
ncbi:hypothetical protein TNCT_24681 [Trichonephila clavata]|uniref:C2H2-type domain-containing protein n=1 Tax=Trichonephila clavata TaxID=2740835 RepID=A0A8X6HUP0_TRICU|nr:hypothetical protein TNCT_24681 [Trichonephila clavata]